MRVRRRFLGIGLALAVVTLSGPPGLTLFGAGPFGMGIAGAAWASGGSDDSSGDDSGSGHSGSGSGSSGSGSSGSGSSGSGSSGSGSSGSGSGSGSSGSGSSGSGSGSSGSGSGSGHSGGGDAAETEDGTSGHYSDDVFVDDGIVVAYVDGHSEVLRGRRLLRFDRAGRLIEDRSASTADRNRMRGIAAQAAALGGSGISSVLTVDASAGEIRVQDALGWVEVLSRDAYLLADPDGNTVARRKPRQRDLQRIRSMLGG